jgi:methyl-accepting chemotaxis protein
MIWFYNLNIARKLALSFAVVIALTVAGPVRHQGAQAGQQRFRRDRHQVDADHGCRTRAAGSSPPLRLTELELVTAVTPQERAAANQAIKTRLEALAKQRAVFEQRMSEPQEKEQYAQFGKNLAAYIKVDEQLAEMAANQQDETRVLFKGESARLYGAMVGNLDAIVKINARGSAQADEEASGVFRGAQRWIGGVLLATVAIGSLLAFVVAANVARPLKEAVEIAQRVARGDLTLRIRPAGRDETGRLMEALRAMNDSLRDIVNEVRQGTDTIATASNEIASGNLDLSNRTEQQAAPWKKPPRPWRADLHREAECRQRPPGQPAGRIACHLDEAPQVAGVRCVDLVDDDLRATAGHPDCQRYSCPVRTCWRHPRALRMTPRRHIRAGSC